MRYLSRELVEIIDVDIPDPGPGEVQVQGLACGVCAWDLHAYRNGPDGPMPAGHEGVGQVAKLGAGISGLKEGDWVTGGGLGFAEFATVAAKSLYLLPKTTRQPKHWIVEPVACIVTGLDHCQIRAGDRLALVGCGFMGLMFVQALAGSFLDRLIVIDTDPERLELAKKLGAAETMLASDVEPAKLADLSIDTVVDCSGNQKGLELSSKLVRRGGRLNLFGWNHGTATFPGDLWHMNGITVVNSAPGSAIRDPWPVAIRLLARGIIDLGPLVTHVAALKDYPALLKEATSGNGRYLKGVVDLATP